jgi:hypothetical protein
LQGNRELIQLLGEDGCIVLPPLFCSDTGLVSPGVAQKSPDHSYQIQTINFTLAFWLLLQG